MTHGANLGQLQEKKTSENSYLPTYTNRVQPGTNRGDSDSDNLTSVQLKRIFLHIMIAVQRQR